MAYNNKHLHFPISLCICWTGLSAVFHSTDLSWISSWVCGHLVGQGRATWFQRPFAELNCLSSIRLIVQHSSLLAGPWLRREDGVGGRGVGFKEKSRNAQAFWVLKLGTSTQLFLLLSTGQMKLQGHLRFEVWRNRFLFFFKRVVASIKKGHRYRWGNACAYFQTIY